VTKLSAFSVGTLKKYLTPPTLSEMRCYNSDALISLQVDELISESARYPIKKISRALLPIL
jgi:hypothetical protein